jgi:hypothetical protein
MPEDIGVITAGRDGAYTRVIVREGAPGAPRRAQKAREKSYAFALEVT